MKFIRILYHIMKKISTFIKIALISSFLLQGCQNKPITTTTTPFTIDLTRFSKHIQETLPLSDAVSKVEIVPLETNENCIIKEAENVWVTSNDIIVYHHYKEPLLRFSRDGKFLNKIGTIGKGPGECYLITEASVNEPAREVYINLGEGIDGGFMVYDFDGNFKRKVTFNFRETFATLMPHLFFLNGNPWFRQDLPVMNKEIGMWNFAQLDSSLQTVKTYSNALYEGREKELEEKCCLYYGWAQYYLEKNIMDLHNDVLQILYHGGDTIYRYQPEEQNFSPAYCVQIDTRPSFSKSRDWIKDEDFFCYFWISNFYDTRDYLYLQAAQDENGYLIRFSKQDGSLALTTNKAKIVRTTFPNGWVHKRRKFTDWGLQNDLCGYPAIFPVEPLADGKHWGTVIDSYQLLSELDTEQLRQLTVKDPAARDKLQQIATTLTDESNPVLFIATLK